MHGHRVSLRSSAVAGAAPRRRQQGGRFYRIVKTNPPTVRDFLSGVATGRIPAGAAPALVRLLEGISAFATFAQACRKSRGVGYRIGEYVAELQIPDAASIRVEKSGGPGHHTLGGDAAELLTHVVRVLPARPPS